VEEKRCVGQGNKIMDKISLPERIQETSSAFSANDAIALDELANRPTDLSQSFPRILRKEFSITEHRERRPIECGSDKGRAVFPVRKMTMQLSPRKALNVPS